MRSVAHVYVEKAVYAIDTPYSYQIPSSLLGEVAVGCRVLVPFGGGNRKVQGFVAAITEEPDDPPLKPIAALIDKTPLFTSEMTEMASELDKLNKAAEGEYVLIAAGRLGSSGNSSAALPAHSHDRLLDHIIHLK